MNGINCGDCVYFVMMWNDKEDTFRCFHPELCNGKYPVSSGEMRATKCGEEGKYFKNKGTEDLMHQYFGVPSWNPFPE